MFPLLCQSRSRNGVAISSSFFVSICTIFLAVVQAIIDDEWLADNIGTKATAVKYGTDISFPMLHDHVSTNYEWLPHNNRGGSSLPVPTEFQNMPVQPLGDRQAFYDAYMKKCIDYTFRHYPILKKNGVADQRSCESVEKKRIQRHARQIPSMRNYTKLGFTKLRAPQDLFMLLQKFWQKNRNNSKPEKWYKGDILTNYWEAPTKMVSLGDERLEGSGMMLMQHIWTAMRNAVEEWTGQTLVESSLYGIRVYPTGAVLVPHVDRLPLVSSAIINVDQDLDEPWPLEVIAHDGMAYNISMEPGDVVLYESHSVLHGRPFPLKGRYMANIFVHFEPIGPLNGPVEFTGDLPPYILPNSPEVPNWREENPNGHQLRREAMFGTASLDISVHHTASLGDVKMLESILNADPSLVHIRDKNGWTALHEAIRPGHVDVVRFLLNQGADPNARTGNKGEGGTPLYYVGLFHSASSIKYHELSNLLQQYNGKLVAPAHDEF